MKNLFDRLWPQMRDVVGRSASIEAWATKVPTQQKSFSGLTSTSIRAADVIRWDRLGEEGRPAGLRRPKGVLQGWSKGAEGNYESTTQDCAELKNLMMKTITPQWQCDLQEVQGLASSSSDLSRFATMEDFATQDCGGLMEHPSPKALDQNLHWNEVRIHDPAGPDYFCRYDWDGRLFMVNQGGSHHFAAAHQMAKELGQDVPLSGKLKTYSLNPQTVSALRARFELFAVPKDPQLKNEFWDGMKAMGATHFSLPLPGPRGAALETVLLPRNDPQAMKVAAVLRREGFGDMGQALTDLAQGVHRHALSQLPHVQAPPPHFLPATLGEACRRLGTQVAQAPKTTPDAPQIGLRRPMRTP